MPTGEDNKCPFGEDNKLFRETVKEQIGEDKILLWKSWQV